jgi:hypothetical protein
VPRARVSSSRHARDSSSVARVPLAQVSDRAQWRFYAGHGPWSANPADGAGVIAPDGAEPAWARPLALAQA